MLSNKDERKNCIWNELQKFSSCEETVEHLEQIYHSKQEKSN